MEVLKVSDEEIQNISGDAGAKWVAPRLVKRIFYVSLEYFGKSIQIGLGVMFAGVITLLIFYLTPLRKAEIKAATAVYSYQVNQYHDETKRLHTRLSYAQDKIQSLQQQLYNADNKNFENNMKMQELIAEKKFNLKIELEKIRRMTSIVRSCVNRLLKKSCKPGRLVLYC
ncbi:hypothetical protein BJI67_11710 [Acidihalobacter aeolianus]|uniref:Uncharacterized protein n=1 Tax=Acidihalobacter aeolianus TaxID=2792603 RepID=A0A1D8K9L7_9GAMM|nr:hypothetical protein BJI67_11710 [Acidihalobacter aeolianus]